MAGLFHDFLLLSKAEYPYRGFGTLYNSPEALRIHDDHLRYLYDSLLWIPCHNPAIKMREHMGLNLYGETIIKKKGAAVAGKVFQAWAELFLCGPEIIELTGNYTVEAEESEGDYEKLKINRDGFVETLETLTAYCKEVILSDDNKFILHMGI
jgi:hypothetical protein